MTNNSKNTNLEWTIQLVSNSSVQSFVDSYGDDFSEFKIFREDEFYYLSLLLPSSVKSEEIKEETENFLSIINGVFYLLNANVKPFSIARVPVSGKEINPENWKSKSNKLIPEILILKRHEDERYCNILCLINSNMNWHEMYLIFEILAKENGKKWKKSKKWKSFGYMSNESPSTGNSGRHYVEGNEESSPESVIPIEEAREMIREACVDLINKKFSLKIEAISKENDNWNF